MRSGVSAHERLRVATAERSERVKPAEATLTTYPSFGWLLALALVAVVLQSTVLRPLSLRGAHVSLVTVVVVWTGLRCGAAMGGLLGLFAGLFEDALGSAGANVLGATLAGFCAGLLNVRFFADSLPVFVSAVAGATLLRGAVSYFVLELGLGERGMFHGYSHLLAWQVVLNAAAAALIALGLRVAANARR